MADLNHPGNHRPGLLIGMSLPFPLHGMEHELSSMYDMTHGVTLALLTPSWMRHTI